MRNDTSLAIIGLLASLSITFSGCLTYYEGYVNGTVKINGSADSQDLERYSIDVGSGENPTTWTTLGVSLAGNGTTRVNQSLLGSLDTTKLADGKYTIRLTVTDKNNVSSTDEVYVTVDNVPDPPTRQCPEWSCAGLASGENIVNITLLGDAYGSNMNCSLVCQCPAGTKMSVRTEGYTEWGYDILHLNALNFTGSWVGVYVPVISYNFSYYELVFDYNNSLSLGFISDRNTDGDTYPGFNVSRIYCSQYCLPIETGWLYSAYISKVRLNTGEHKSSREYYSDISQQPFTSLQPGQTYTLQVRATNDYNDTVYIAAWIDYNQNYNMTDPGEVINLGSYTFEGNRTFSASYTVPTNAKTGYTKMRVMADYFNITSPCESSPGEVEDYTVEISSEAGQCTLTGDTPPCGEATLSEVVALINGWSQGQATLSDVIALINLWAA